MNSVNAARHDLSLADQLYREGRLEDARVLAARIVQCYPDYYAALHTYGLIESVLGNHGPALLALTRANAVLPGQPVTLTALADVYLQQGNRDVAYRLIEEAIDNGAKDAATHVRLGELCRDEGDYEAALSAFERALALSPRLPRAKLGRAAALAELGRCEESYIELSSALDRDPHDFDAAAAMAALPASVVSRDIAEYMLLQPRPAARKSIVDQARYLFFQANIQDKTGHWELAWQYLLEANALIFKSARDRCRRNSERQEKSLQLIRRHVAVEGRAAEHWKTSLFILGPAKSGKTAVEAALARSQHVRRGHENPALKTAVNETLQAHGFVPTGELSALPEQLEDYFRYKYAQQLSRRTSNERVFVTTSSGLIHDALRIAATVPNAKFIFMTRDRQDLALRILQSLYPGGHYYAYSLPAIFEHIDWYEAMTGALATKLGANCMTVRFEEAADNPAGLVGAAEQLLGFDLEIKDIGAIKTDIGVSRPYAHLLDAVPEQSEGFPWVDAAIIEDPSGNRTADHAVLR
jgi:tetratricopeptide (TPR) repeat protein